MVYVAIDIIEGGTFAALSFTITCSPSTNTPVVCNKDLSLALFVVSATNPIAPLDKPLTLDPTFI